MLKSDDENKEDGDEPNVEEKDGDEPNVEEKDDDEPNVEEELLAEHEVEIEVEQVVDAEKTKMPERHLQKSEISESLSMLGKTAEGIGYAFLKATINGLKLTHIEEIKAFEYIMFLDLSDNYLDIDALQVITELPSLVFIQANNNKLQSAALKQMKYLQVIVMSNNQITTVHDVFQEQLSTLEVGNNKIQKLVFDKNVPTVRVLDFRNNLLTEITDLNFPMLDSLYLAANNIKSLVGIEKLVSLRVLHVRNNPIKLLNGFDKAMAKLQYINLRNCKVTTLIQIKKLRVLKGLQTLILRGCPYMGGTGEEEPHDVEEEEEDDPELRVEVLAALPRLKRINKETVSSEERQEAKDLMTQWFEDGENDEEEAEGEQLEEEQSRNEY